MHSARLVDGRRRAGGNAAAALAAHERIGLGLAIVFASVLAAAMLVSAQQLVASVDVAAPTRVAITPDAAVHPEEAMGLAAASADHSTVTHAAADVTADTDAASLTGAYDASPAALPSPYDLSAHHTAADALHAYAAWHNRTLADPRACSQASVLVWQATAVSLHTQLPSARTQHQRTSAVQRR